MNDKIWAKEPFNLEEYIESKNKSFDDWNEEKKGIHHNNGFKRTKIWQIWMCKIWVNIWGEISKGNDYDFQRPVLIVSEQMEWGVVYIFPFSTQSAKYESSKQFTIPFNDWEKHWLDKITNIIINQLKVISTKRLKRLFNDIKVQDSYIPLLWKNRVNELLDIFIERVLLKKTSHKD